MCRPRTTGSREFLSTRRATAASRLRAGGAAALPPTRFAQKRTDGVGSGFGRPVQKCFVHNNSDVLRCTPLTYRISVPPPHRQMQLAEATVAPHDRPLICFQIDGDLILVMH